jgi:hypothetical protein
VQIKFLERKDIDFQIEDIIYDLSTQISKNIEDYLFVNQLITKEDFKKISQDRSQLRGTKELSQEAQQTLL